MGWQDDKDLEESGIRSGPPVGVLVAVAFGAFLVIGGIVSTCGNLPKPSMQNNTQSNTPATTTAYIDKVVPPPKRTVIDGLGKGQVQGSALTDDTMRCTFEHGTKVLVWVSGGDRAKVSAGGCLTWIQTKHLRTLE